MKGDTETIVVRAERFLRLSGSPPRMLARTLAETEDGALLITVWSSPEARSSFHRSAECRAAIAGSRVGEVIDAQTSAAYPVRFMEIASGGG